MIKLIAVFELRHWTKVWDPSSHFFLLDCFSLSFIFTRNGFVVDDDNQPAATLLKKRFETLLLVCWMHFVQKILFCHIKFFAATFFWFITFKCPHDQLEYNANFFDYLCTYFRAPFYSN